MGSGTHPRPPRSYREERPRARGAPRQYTASAAFQRTSPRFLWEPAFLCQPRAPRPSERVRGLAGPASDSAAAGCLQLIKPDPQTAQPSGTSHVLAASSLPLPLPRTQTTLDPHSPSKTLAAPALPDRSQCQPRSGTWMGQGLLHHSGPQFPLLGQIRQRSKETTAACGLSPALVGSPLRGAARLLQGPPSPRIFNGSPLPSGQVSHSGPHRGSYNSVWKCPAHSCLPLTGTWHAVPAARGPPLPQPTKAAYLLSPLPLPGCAALLASALRHPAPSRWCTEAVSPTRLRAWRPGACLWPVSSVPSPRPVGASSRGLGWFNRMSGQEHRDRRAEVALRRRKRHVTDLALSPA